ncbi:MAG TPA: Gfo/Idh/MocA family oxidoreductase [Bacteroidales bacterium]|jgi:predicted dehydrogenase|nr:Gfo/Idh/MocA family oxidoreductase [Bacteroidales bacterium]MDI9553463.1 Gfo/Idh/MocA family oxidoreductase [Bacteroidota bacterium]MBP7039196.1 Gfo/Idh/MocA family oxidoreductase [Bacteroidales bacterium]HNY53372.1 Gfo/Idh/MocA family oxidoreductase [Bacteroidales bacterium]HOG57331.1 Gfo/Idh/MocA family oxidoreductase [Bacteroidales bacterium]
MNPSRRDFIKTASVIAAGSVIPVDLLAQARKRKAGPNDKIGIGLIGVRSQGYSNLASFLKNPEVECVALCDIDKNFLDSRTADIVKLGFAAPKHYSDYRKMLDNKDIDLVIIGTPDHWHCLQFVHSLEAGKHIYVEKPIGNSIAEINIMWNATRKYGKMVQVGQWQRSQPHFVDAINYLKSGKLGRIRTCKAWSYVDWKGAVPKVPDEPVPAGVDYTTWLGPAPIRPFNMNRFHFTWRWYWEYGNGLMTDWGVHLIDYILYGMDKSIPSSVMAIGGKYAFPEDDMVTPDTMTAVYDFNDFTMIWEHTIGIGLGNWKRAHGMSYIGENGTLVLDRQGWEVVPEKQKIEAVPVQKNVGNGLDLHTRNFLDCLKNNTPEKLNANIDIGRNVGLVAQMGNIAFRTGEKVSWNDATQKFGTETANALITPVYHNGYKLPSY